MIKFEEVIPQHKKNFEVFTGEKGAKHSFPKVINLPKRSDDGSAGYDFTLPKDLKLMPNQAPVFVYTDVKALMPKDVVLKIHIRSSVGIKHGIEIPNNVGIIDSSYYGNVDNDGNIILALINRTGKTVEFKAGDKVAQGIFQHYLTTDDDIPLMGERVGGVGSTGK